MRDRSTWWGWWVLLPVSPVPWLELSTGSDMTLLWFCLRHTSTAQGTAACLPGWGGGQVVGMNTPGGTDTTSLSVTMKLSAWSAVSGACSGRTGEEGRRSVVAVDGYVHIHVHHRVIMFLTWWCSKFVLFFSPGIWVPQDRPQHLYLYLKMRVCKCRRTLQHVPSWTGWNYRACEMHYWYL